VAAVFDDDGCDEDDDDCEDEDDDDEDPGFNPFAVDLLLEPGGGGGPEGGAEAEAGAGAEEVDGFILVGPGGGGL
jgi:hypothetical protein